MFAEEGRKEGRRRKNWQSANCHGERKLLRRPRVTAFLNMAAAAEHFSRDDMLHCGAEYYGGSFLEVLRFIYKPR